MKLKAIVQSKSNPDNMSLTRFLPVAVFVVLSAALLINAGVKPIAWEVYVAFPVGVASACAPHLFKSMLHELKGIIAAWKGTDATQGQIL